MNIYKKFFEADSSYLSKAQFYIKELAKVAFAGKFDDALDSFVADLLEISAPGPLRRMVAKTYNVKDPGISEISPFKFIIKTLKFAHGGKSDDAFESFIEFMLNNAKPKSVVNFATKWAKSNEISQEIIDELALTSGLVS